MVYVNFGYVLLQSAIVGDLKKYQIIIFLLEEIADKINTRLLKQEKQIFLVRRILAMKKTAMWFADEMGE